MLCVHLRGLNFKDVFLAVLCSRLFPVFLLLVVVERKASTGDILFNGTNNTQALYFNIILYGPHENPFGRGGGHAAAAEENQKEEEEEEDEEETRSTGASFTFEKLYKLHRFWTLCVSIFFLLPLSVASDSHLSAL